MSRVPALGCRRAFTLIELMATLFVLSLVLTLVLPYFHFSSNRLNSEAREVASILRYLNETAASRKETMEITFDIDQRRLSWTDADSRKSETFQSLDAVELQSRGMLREGELKVFFSPLGLREFLSVHLKEDEESKTVAFNPISGRVKIYSEETEETGKE